jgi:hypothetical protein
MGQRSGMSPERISSLQATCERDAGLTGRPIIEKPLPCLYYEWCLSRTGGLPPTSRSVSCRGDGGISIWLGSPFLPIGAATVSWDRQP